MKRWFYVLPWLAGTVFAQQPIGTVAAQGVTVRGAVTLSDNTAEIRSGAELATSGSTAILKLSRGGTLKICPRTSIQVTASPNGRDLLIAVNAGAVETDYNLPGGADAVMTPDFQLQLTGPGTFHYTIGANGNELCATALAGSNASIIVTENLGAGTYQVRPGDSVHFRQSTVAEPELKPASVCGCPETAVKAAPPELGFPEQQSQAAAQQKTAGEAPTAPPIAPPPAPTPPSQVVTQVDVPLTFRDAVPPPPEPYTNAALAPLPEIAKPVVVPPPKPEKKRWYQRFGGALKKIFGG